MIFPPFIILFSLPTFVFGLPLNAPLVSLDQFTSAVTSCGYPAPSPEQYDAFVSEAYPSGGIDTARELAMFLAEILWESDGLRAKREYACEESGCPGSYSSGSDQPGQSYYGRGYIQLTWADNYRAASEDLFGNDILLQTPDLVATNEEDAWATAFWYWKTRVRTQPGVLDGQFGAATNAINGGLECGGGGAPQAHKRYEFYTIILPIFNVHETPNESGCY